MLDTVIEIGRVLRAAPDGLKHHRYIKKAPVPDAKRNPVRFWLVPVAEDGSFSFGAVPLLDEVKQKQLFYLNYKQSDADSSKPYIYGDLYRSVTKTGEDGNFRFGDPLKKSWSALNSFQRGEDKNPIDTARVKRFRCSFRDQMDEIEKFLRENTNAYIHFDFAGKGWQEMEELTYLNRGLLQTFFEKTERGYVASGFLFKTLGAGTIRTPGFGVGNEFRNRIFRDENQALDLLYGINYSSRAIVRKNDFKAIVLPHGDGLTAAMIERFFEQRVSEEPGERAQISENDFRTNLSPVAGLDEENSDDLFSFIEDDPTIARFDCIFSKAGGTKPDIDMVEIVGLERSRLVDIGLRVRKIRNAVQKSRSAFFLSLYGKSPKKDFPAITITGSFLKLLGDGTSDKKKYQNHLFRAIPQIFNGIYTDDPVLIPALIEKTEFSIRNGDLAYFNEAKFALAFLRGIQSAEKVELVEAKEQNLSRQIGLSLGIMARPLRIKINSFDKNYAGLLSRRITTLADVKALANEINQKLILHDVLYPDVRNAWTALTEATKIFSGTYNKNECAFGFFESYFAPVKATTDVADEKSDHASDVVSSTSLENS